MDSALRDKTCNDLDDKIEKAEETIARKRKLESMLRKVKEEQGTVPDHIFIKVQNEYQKQLDEILAALDPVEAEIMKAKESVSLEITEQEALIENVKNSLTEVEFRFKVGEFDEASCKDKLAPLQESLDKKTKNMQALMDSLKKYNCFVDALHSDTDATPTAESRKSSTQVQVGLETQPSPSESSETDGQSNTESEFVNPNEWLDDFYSTSKKTGGDNDNSRPKTDSELFEDLLEDVPKEAKAVDASVPDPEINDTKSFDSPETTPLLVIKPNTGSEKRIPVLPITLTIGREHDNNIEIKDEEAARYHARIVFKNSQYVLESLETSRSTLVNGKQVTEAVLQDADTITIGKTKMFFMMT